MEQERKYRSLPERLAKYNLAERQDQLVDLKVEPHQVVEMNDEDPAFKPHHVYLKPERAQDLKRWIGIPNDAVHVSHTVQDNIIVEKRANHYFPRLLSPPTIAMHDMEIQSYLYPYLFGSSEEMETDYAERINELLASRDIKIGMFLLLDIYISAGAQLVIPAKKSILFARYITVEASGEILMKAPLAQIDCAGFRRLPAYTLARDPTKSPWDRPQVR